MSEKDHCGDEVAMIHQSTNLGLVVVRVDESPRSCLVSFECQPKRLLAHPERHGKRERERERETWRESTSSNHGQ